MRSKLFKFAATIFLSGITILILRAQGELYQNPGIYILEEVSVKGTNDLDPSNIKSLSGLKEGDKVQIPGPVFSSAIKNIWSQKLVGDVQIYLTKVEGNKASVTIFVTEQPRLSKFRIENVKKNELNDILANLPPKSSVVSNALIKNTKISIKRFYLDKGFFNTEVDISTENDPLLPNHVFVDVKVKKGKKVKIETIDFEGNKVFVDKTLRKQMKETKQKKFTRIFSRSKYIKANYIADKDKVIDFYNSEGFRDAEIVKDSVYQIDEKNIGIKIWINEGNKYFIRNIAWVGNYIHDDDELNAILGVDKGEVYNKQLIQTRLNFNPTGPDVSSLYLDDGYLFFSVNPVEVAVVGDSIDVEMRVYEGQQATIGKIIINGNTKTSDHVVLREIRTLPGEKFSRTDLIRSQRELAQLGYFDPEQMGINPIPNPQTGTVDIEYSLVEKPSDQLQLSGGWGGFVGFVGTVGLAFNNFSIRNVPKLKNWDPLPAGDGQRLQLSIQANGRAFQTYNLSFTEPWLGGRKPNSFTVSLRSSIQNRFDADDDRIGFLKVRGATVNLGRRLSWPDDNFTLSNTVSYLNYNIENFNNTLCNTCQANNFSFKTTLARNNIGINPQFPTMGASTSLSLDLTPPYSWFNESRTEIPVPDRYNWVEYHKWMFDNSWFIQLTHNKKSRANTDGSKTIRPLVLNVRNHFGFIGAYNENMGVGPFDRFIVGGDGLSGFSFLLGSDIIGLRGYENNSLNPAPDDGGGVVYNKHVLELRYPLVTEGIATVFLLSFIEAGNNFSSFEEYDPFELKRSAGMGIRIFMPAFGMIGIDYGKGFDEIEGSPEANAGQIHFVIGQQIR